MDTGGCCSSSCKLLQLWKPGRGSAKNGRGRVCTQSFPLHSLLYCLEHTGLAGVDSSDCCLSSHPKAMAWRSAVSEKKCVAESAPAVPHLGDSIVGRFPCLPLPCLHQCGSSPQWTEAKLCHSQHCMCCWVSVFVCLPLQFPAFPDAAWKGGRWHRVVEVPAMGITPLSFSVSPGSGGGQESLHGKAAARCCPPPSSIQRRGASCLPHAS